MENSFNITGFVNPNADLDNTTNSAKAEKENMTQNGMIILCGGTKNIGKNETSKGLRCISQFLEHQLHIKVLIMKAPHRHNLIPTSCVNKEVANFNRKLQKITKKFDNAETVKMSTKRDHFTQHGLHMNGSGKDWITSLLATKIRQILTTPMPKHPIHLTWKVEASEDDIEARKVKEVRNSPSHESDLNKELAGHNKQCIKHGESDSASSLGGKESESENGDDLMHRASKRTKKSTHARFSDFLWT